MNAISGNTDNKIYLYYYPCGSTTQEFITYSTAGTYSNEICYDNCSISEPYLYSSFDGGSTPQNSYLIEIGGDCSSSMLKTVLCASGSVTNTVSSEGLNIMLNTFELDNPYGNYSVTVSATTLNTTTEVFVGNYNEKIGEVFELVYGTNNITKNCGYFSSNNSKILDIVVYSKNNGPFQPFDINVSVTCSDTISCDEVVSGGTETYRQDVIINVTDAGNIIYNTETGQQSLYVPVGSKTLTDCLIVESIKSPLILSDPATFTITYSGDTCTTLSGTTGDCVTITFDAKYGFSATAYWVDCNGVVNTRFVNAGEIFTTIGQYGSGSGLPVTYEEQAIQ